MYLSKNAIGPVNLQLAVRFIHTGAVPIREASAPLSVRILDSSHDAVVLRCRNNGIAKASSQDPCNYNATQRSMKRTHFPNRSIHPYNLERVGTESDVGIW